MPRKKVGNSFLDRMALPSPGEGTGLKGRLRDLDGADPAQRPLPLYEHPHGTLWVGDSLRWLERLEPGSVTMMFADPPYSLGKVDWDEFESRDAYLAWSLRWIELAARALRPEGSLYVCGFSEILADLRRPAARFFRGCRWLVWHYRNKASLAHDWGRSHESILHLRKGPRPVFNLDQVRVPYGDHTVRYPVHPQAASSQFGAGGARDGWTPNPAGAKPRDVFEIPVTSNGMREKTPHPTQKPEELLRKLILASSNEGDVVADPFAGSGTTLVCAQQLRRPWLGCELNPEYASWAVLRLEQVPERPVAEWIERDRATASRRESIR